jgi:hypothetical protein
MGQGLFATSLLALDEHDSDILASISGCSYSIRRAYKYQISASRESRSGRALSAAARPPSCLSVWMAAALWQLPSLAEG